MASANQILTRGWIQYLKNNQIAELQSNPKTGRINYKREPTVTDLTTYLGKDYDEDAILNAIQQVKGKGDTDAENDTDATNGELATQGNRDPSTWHNKEMSPGQQQDPKLQIGNSPSQPDKVKKYNNDDAEDATYSQRGVTPYQGNKVSTWQNKETTPSQAQTQIGAEMPWKSKPKKYNTDDAQDVDVKDKTQKLDSPSRKLVGKNQHAALDGPPSNKVPDRKPRFKYRYKKGQLKEAIRDWQGDTLSEREIQDIFKILSQPAAKEKSDGTETGTSPQGNSGVNADDSKQDDMNAQIRKLKSIIRDTMSDQQRAALYRALTDA